jgi:triphosphoribosyl-dephospho-CoA synthase
MIPSPGTLAQVACLMEATARKPGNVHRFADFDDASYLDFALSAQAIGPAMDAARLVGVGRAVLNAVEATRRVVSTNTNLGMILLLAPLCVAFEPGKDLRAATRRVLDLLTIDDARHAYRAIRTAEPGGLGSASAQDVADEPTVTLLDAMRIAADRDLVARQYATGYGDVFETALPALRSAIVEGRSLEQAIVRTHVVLLSRTADTLILRKRGIAIAEEVSRRAAESLDTGDFASFDRYLREDGHARNPGATADLIAAALFAAMAEGTITLPRPSGLRGWSDET